MQVKVEITVPPIPPPTPNIWRVEQEGMYWLLPQYKPNGYVGKSLVVALENNKAYPSTIKGYDNWKIALTDPQQWLLFGLFVEFAPPHIRALGREYLIKKFKGLCDGGLAFFNGRGSDANWFAIDGSNLGREPICHETITTTRNPVRMVPGTKTFDAVYEGTVQKWIWTETIDYSTLNPPSGEIVTSENHWWVQQTVNELKYKYWLVHRATMIYPDKLSDGTYVENPFPHLHIDGYNAFDVPMFWASKKQMNALPLSRLQPLPVGSWVPSYYNPSRTHKSSSVL